MRTRGGRPHHRQAAWHAVDTHVQKAAKHQPKREYSRCDYWIHQASTHAFAITTARGFGLIICRQKRETAGTKVIVRKGGCTNPLLAKGARSGAPFGF